MQPSIRLVLFGIVLAALAPGLCLLVYFLVAETSAGSSTPDFFQGLAALLSASFLVSALPALLLGLPYVLWLRARNALNWLNSCLGAMVIGAITLATLSWASRWDHSAPTVASFFLGAAFGLAGGVGFCLGARPNNSFKPKPLRGSA
jgi:hypothetical protein